MSYHDSDSELLGAAHLDWKPLPDSPGDWLWIALWSCKCCVFKSGIAFVQDIKGWTDEDLKGYASYPERLPGDLLLGWEGSQRSYGVNADGMAVEYNMTLDQITAWAKIAMPAFDQLDDTSDGSAMCNLKKVEHETDAS